MFSQDSKLAVLESKLGIYEDLSREMLTKLEAAVDTISKSNHQIALILERHENRLDQSDKSDELILNMIKDLQTQNKEEHQKSAQKIEKLELRLEDVGKIKWMTIGCGVVLAVLATAFSTLASGWWTPSGMNDARQIQQGLAK